MYNGFRTCEKGPLVHKLGAPTLVVRVMPPAYRTPLKRIYSPKISKIKPDTMKELPGCAKYKMIKANGIGV
jgi:hypothetical protein